MILAILSTRVRYLYHFLAFLFLLSCGIAFMLHTHFYRFDPDRYYHLALSRQMVEGSNYIPHQLPQIEGLHWNKYFPDKEFLFHQLTALGYKIGGENGSALAVSFVGLLALFSVYFLASSIVSPFVALLFSTAIMVSVVFFDRLVLLRPHVLSIFLFTLLLHALFKRSAKMGFFSAALMAMAYHGLYIPLTPIFAGICVFFFSPLDSKKEKNFILASLAGLFIGVVANPYFPSNLVMGWIILKIPSLMQGDLSQVVFGNELYPMTTHNFIKSLFSPFLVLIIACISLRKKILNEKMEQDKLLFTFCAAVFFLMCLQSPRGNEYWIPVSVVLAAILFRQWEENRKVKIAFFACAFLIPIPFFYTLFFNPFTGRDKAMIGEMAVVKAIPTADRGAFVFNCEWDTTPFLFYARPDLRFIDILDPSLLYFANKEAFLARQRLTHAQVGDPYGLVHNSFGARYSLCKELGMVSLMRKDPDFIEIYPGNLAVRSETENPVLFRLREFSSPEFLHKFTAYPLLNTSGANYKEKNPTSIVGQQGIEIDEPSSYLNLKVHFKSLLENEKSDISCALVNFQKDELKNHVGAKFLGLGGGRNLRVWRNGKAFYSSVNGIVIPRRIEVLVPIPGGLTPNDQISIVACSALSAPFWGIAASLWTEKQLADVCREKRSSFEKNRDGLPWQFSGVSQESCLGPIVPLTSQKL